MRKRALNTVYQLAKKNPNIVFVGSDLSSGTLKEFKQEMPERFFMEGIAEGHLIGFCAGLAMSGKTVYFNTISTFLTRRCFEQIVVDLAMAKANVRLVGNGGGFVYAPLGNTHLAIEDISILRAIPNMGIIVPSDPDEMERAIIASEKWEGPLYIRIAKGGEPIVTKAEHGFEIGKGIVHRNPGKVTLMTTGIMLERALQAADNLEKQGISCGVAHFHTVKPLDEKLIKDIINKSETVLTLEENTIVGGLGSAVAEIIAESGPHKKLNFKRLGIPDVFADQYGTQNSLIKRYEFDLESIIQTVKLLAKD